MADRTDFYEGLHSYKSRWGVIRRFVFTREQTLYHHAVRDTGQLDDETDDPDRLGLGRARVHCLRGRTGIDGPPLGRGRAVSHRVRLARGRAHIVDGIDGVFARAARVDQVLPWFDGGLIDLVVDYLTYVVAPALILHRAHLLPGGCGIPAAATILISSLYHYGRTDIKSEDWYFRGFPAFWNVVVFYLYLCEASQAINLTVVIVLVALTFVPALWVHPLRAAELRRVNVGVVCVTGPRSTS